MDHVEHQRTLHQMEKERYQSFRDRASLEGYELSALDVYHNKYPSDDNWVRIVVQARGRDCIYLLVNRDAVDPEMSDYLPRIRGTVNVTEYTFLPNYYKAIYFWDDEGSLYRLADRFKKWATMG